MNVPSVHLDRTSHKSCASKVYASRSVLVLQYFGGGRRTLRVAVPKSCSYPQLLWERTCVRQSSGVAVFDNRDLELLCGGIFELVHSSRER